MVVLATPPFWFATATTLAIGEVYDRRPRDPGHRQARATTGDVVGVRLVEGPERRVGTETMVDSGPVSSARPSPRPGASRPNRCRSSMATARGASG